MMIDAPSQNQLSGKSGADSGKNQTGQTDNEIIIRTMQEDMAKSGLSSLKKEVVLEKKPIAPTNPFAPKPITSIGGTIGQIAPPQAPTAKPAPAPMPPPAPVLPTQKIETPPTRDTKNIETVFSPPPAPRPQVSKVLTETLKPFMPPAPTRTPPASLPTTQPTVGGGTSPQAAVTPSRPTPPVSAGSPTLKVPPRVIPPREVPKILPNHLPKIVPVWVRLGIIAVAVFLLTFLGLYVYWKIFIQEKPEAKSQLPTTQQPKTPTLPVNQQPAVTPPLKFFNKLPNKAVTIELAIKDTANLGHALQSEAAILEERESVKQIFISYRGKPVELAEFLNLMQIFVPQDFLANYENQYAFFYFSQKEGARAGLVLKAKNSQLAQTQLDQWEKTTMPSDILPLFPTSLRSIKTPILFKSYSLAGQPVRYVNVPILFSSLNYSIYNNLLIITSSSRAMFKVMNDLTGQSTSRAYLDQLGASIDDFAR